MTEISETDQKLNSLLEIEPEIVGEEEIVGELVVAEEHLPVPAPQPNENRDIEYDYETSREMHRSLLDQGQEALDGILKVAKESQHPRAYEVAANLLKHMSDMTDKVMGLHEKRKALEAKGAVVSNATQVNVEKAVFVGSTSDLLKQVKANKQ
jgi:DUF1009 family protein